MKKKEKIYDIFVVMFERFTARPLFKTDTARPFRDISCLNPADLRVVMTFKNIFLNRKQKEKTGRYRLPTRRAGGRTIFYDFN